MNRDSNFIVALLLIFLAGSVHAQDADNLRIAASDGAAGDRFGAAVAGSEAFVVVGAPDAGVNGDAGRGAAYIFERDGCTLREVAKLTAADGRAGDGFGGSVAIGKDMILVGSREATVNGQRGTGAVYVFTREDGRWVQSDKLFSRDSLVSDGFGASIAVDDETVLVGAPFASGNFGPPGSYQIGAVHVFEKDDGEWDEEQRLTAVFEEFASEFGATLAIENGKALIGAPAFQDDSGIVFVYERDDGEWEWEGYVSPGPGTHGAAAGIALAMQDRRFIIGAPGNETRDTFLSGVVHVFEWDRDDVERRDDLAPGDWSAGARFGSSAAMTKDFIAAGATDVEAVYLFKREGRDWNEVATVPAPASGERFGGTLAFAGRFLVAGASEAAINGRERQGAIYVYALSD